MKQNGVWFVKTVSSKDSVSRKKQVVSQNFRGKQGDNHSRRLKTHRSCWWRNCPATGLFDVCFISSFLSLFLISVFVHSRTKTTSFCSLFCLDKQDSSIPQTISTRFLFRLLILSQLSSLALLSHFSSPCCFIE